MNEVNEIDAAKLKQFESQLDGFKFDAGKSIRYHSHLRCGWQRADHWNKVITLFLGTGVALSTIGKWPLAVLITGLLTAFSSSLDMVIGFSEKARIYDDLYKEWCEYLIKLEGIGEKALNEVSIIEMRQERYKIERNEPSVFRIMEKHSSAEEARAQGREVNDEWKLCTFQKFVCFIAG